MDFITQNQRDSQEAYLVWNATTENFEHGKTGMDQLCWCVLSLSHSGNGGLQPAANQST